MSSDMKDARWELAYKRFTAVSGVDWDDLPYREQNHLLESAQILLYHMDSEEVHRLAEEFRA